MCVHMMGWMSLLWERVILSICFFQNTTIGLYRDQEQVSHSVHLKYFYFARKNIWTVSLIEIIILAVFFKIRDIIYIMSFIDILYIKILVSTTFHVDKHVVPGWCHQYQLFRPIPSVFATSFVYSKPIYKIWTSVNKCCLLCI